MRRATHFLGAGGFTRTRVDLWASTADLPPLTAETSTHMFDRNGTPECANTARNVSSVLTPMGSIG